MFDKVSGFYTPSPRKYLLSLASFRFDFSKRDGTLLDDVSFTSQTGKKFALSNELHGKDITGNELSIEAVMELLGVMRAFTESL